ncbi:MAG: hypothetical protein COW71_12215 [Ignavibacteriales bacterium CG18_big_fil_WC_8_21_14_2_50_31_20]|nr:MAG: hypothetical protein COW71_12215 [Ignavibacteriales bacterium CG18_big_fil_WC_8_21_14_2_50_31_20]
MESFVRTIKEYIDELNAALPLSDKGHRNKKVSKIASQFYLSSRKWAKQFGLNSLDKIAIYDNHYERNLFEIVDRFDVKSPKIIELSNEMFFNSPMPMQAETIFATVISTYSEIEYYKQNNWYPREFVKDIIVISFLIKTTHYFQISIDEARLRVALSYLPSFIEEDFYLEVCTEIDNYLEKKESEIEDIENLSNIADAFITSNKLDSINSIVGLLSAVEVNNNRISEMITELMEYESKGVALNSYLITSGLLNAMLLTISDFPIYLDNEETYYNTVVRLAIIIKGLYKEIKIEK